MSTIHKRLSFFSTSRTEKKLFDVACCLNDDWHVWMNVKLNFSVAKGDLRGSEMDREVDCILFHRKYGLLLIEAKDGQISTKEDALAPNGFVWLQNRREERSPVEQVQSLTHPLHDHFSTMFPKDVGNGYSHVRVQWGVAFGDMENTSSVGSNALPPRRAILKRDLKSSSSFERQVKRILETPEASLGNVPFKNDELSEENTNRLFAFLGCFDEPSWPELWDMRANCRVEPTQIQEMLMESISRNPRMRIEGVAGSGKSLMVQWEARRLIEQGKRVAVLCYNDLLAENLEADFRKSGFEESQLVVNGFFRFAQKYVRLAKVPGAPKKEPEQKELKKEYFEKLPAYFAEALKLLKGKANRFFDAVIIDEGQDFENSWIDVALKLLADPKNGIIRFFYDPMQVLYKGRNVLGNKQINELPVMVLKKGYRSTKQILSWIYDQTEMRISCYKDTPEGNPVDVRVYDNPEDQIELLRKEVTRLKSKGVEPKDILVVSLRSRYNSGLSALNDEVFKWSEVNDSLSSVNINIVSAYRYKGLDKRVVILTDLEPSDNDPGAPHSKSNLLLVGATRAKEHLVVFKQRRKIR